MEEEFPFVVWYQCRMCTHIFLDDLEKMFSHLEKRHGAMIDCEELRKAVLKNGLVSNPSPDNLKTEGAEEFEDNDQADEHSALPRPRYIENEDEFGESEMVLVAAEDVGNYADENGEYAEDTYEENEYQPIKDVEVKYNYVNDDEEQLAEEDPELNVDGYVEDYDNEDEEEDPQDYINCVDAEIGSEGDDPNDTVNFAEDYNEEDYYHDGEEGEVEEGEIILGSMSNSFNSEDMDDDDEEEQMEGEHDEQIVMVNYSDPSNLNGRKNGNGVDKNLQVENDQALLNGIGYSCKFCGKFFTTRRGVETHEQHHKSQSLLPNAPVKRRSNEPKMYPCKLCKRKYFQTFKELKSHVKSHTSDRIHICKFCCSTFNNTASLTKHLTIHKRENPNKCFCGKTFVSANTLKIHKKIHTGIKPFVCEFRDCGRAFVTKSTLESHLRTHTGEKPYICSIENCNSSFTTSSAKYRHERHVHKVHHPNGIE